MRGRCAINALVPDGSASQRMKPQKVAALEPPAAAAALPKLQSLPRTGLVAVEAQLARLTRDPQELLEAVVGLPGPGRRTTATRSWTSGRGDRKRL